MFATQFCAYVKLILYQLRCSVFQDAFIKPSRYPLFYTSFAILFTNSLQLQFLFFQIVFYLLLAIKVKLVSTKLNVSVETMSCVLSTCTTSSLCLVSLATFKVRLLLSFLTLQVWYLVGRQLYTTQVASTCFLRTKQSLDYNLCQPQHKTYLYNLALSLLVYLFVTQPRALQNLYQCVFLYFLALCLYKQHQKHQVTTQFLLYSSQL